MAAAAPKPPTHTAYAPKRLGRRYTRWVEVGSGRLAEDGSFTGYLDRTPTGGWTGFVHFTPIGKAPPAEPTAVDEEGDNTAV